MKMNGPFSGISELQKNKLLKMLQTHTYNFNKNEEILSTLQSENIICIVLEGNAEIVNINYNGEENLIEELQKNSVFGTNISNINDNEHQIRATEKTQILVIDYNKLINKKYVNYSYYSIFITNLFDIINHKSKENNDRIRILTKKTIRNKLLSYFENEYRKTRSKFIYIPTNFKDLADYLAINRSAMFRELKSLKEEKFIKVDGNRITLLYTPVI